MSNDNAYAESIFKTCKYRSDYPYKGFLTIDEARDWVLQFSHWYNFNHKHSGIKYVTPHQRHSGLADSVLANRKEVYRRAKEQNPERWSGDIRDWNLPQEVHLNPERETVKVRVHNVVIATTSLTNTELQLTLFYRKCEIIALLIELSAKDKE